MFAYIHLHGTNSFFTRKISGNLIIFTFMYTCINTQIYTDKMSGFSTVTMPHLRNKHIFSVKSDSFRHHDNLENS